MTDTATLIETPQPLSLRERLADLSNKSGAFHAALQEAVHLISDGAKKHWPEAPAFTVVWQGRDEIPPNGMIWASDGESVWLIHSNGRPIPTEAIKVRFWTQALIPAPPNPSALRAREARGHE